MLKSLLKRADLQNPKANSPASLMQCLKTLSVGTQKNARLNMAKKVSESFLSPGLISTDMGNLESKDGGMLIPFAAEKRKGEAEELGFAIAS